MKNFYLLVFLLFSIFLMPDNAFACGSKSKRDHSATEISSAKSKKDCCDAAGHKDKKHHCCNHNCKNSKCICTSSSSIFLVSNETGLQAINDDFYDESQKFNYPETSISSGFSSLYLKPKIG